MTHFFNGLLLGFAFTMPIGTQNIFVIRNSIHSNFKRALLTALVVSLMDITLAGGCFLGLGSILKDFEVLKFSIQFVGSLYILKIAVDLFKASAQEIETPFSRQNITQIIKSSFIITWLNPHAIIDGTILLGSIRTSLPTEAETEFIIGLFSASFLWFITLSSCLSYFKNLFSVKAMTILNKTCSFVLIYFGVKLLINVFK
jgi:L-lysine exporter family protein LysE/ArgO